jgi:hypothetical protein
MTWWNVDIIRKRAEHLGWNMATRATLIVIAVITSTVARADPLPVPFTGGNCPFGYYWTGSYCLPAGVPGAAAKPPSGSCPNGWLASGNSCLRSGGRN